MRKIKELIPELKAEERVEVNSIEREEKKIPGRTNIGQREQEKCEGLKSQSNQYHRRVSG